MDLRKNSYSEILQVNDTALKNIRNHPFIKKSRSNTLTKGETIRWIFCAGRESETFPSILENMLAYCDNSTIQKILQENLDDEYGNGNMEHTHFNHYLQLLDKLGIERTAFRSYNEKAGIRLAIELAESISNSKKLAIALGYMLINEGMTPLTYSAIKKSCMSHYPDLSTPFFDMHIEVDKHHVEELLRAIEQLPPEKYDEVKYGINLGERGMAVLLDEVVGIFNI